MGTTMIVAIEGGDQEGKATQSQMLFDELGRRGLKVRLMHFPDYQTPTGSKIRQLLEGSEPPNPETIHRLFARNRLEKLEEIESAEPGSVLIIDRYIHSNLAYGLANGMDRRWLEQIDGKMPCPDLVILLDMDPAEALKRRGPSRDQFEKVDFARKVREQYLELASEQKWHVVDAAEPKGDVHEEILETVVRRLPAARNP